jgi:hypothetical protein
MNTPMPSRTQVAAAKDRLVSNVTLNGTWLRRMLSVCKVPGGTRLPNVA